MRTIRVEVNCGLIVCPTVVVLYFPYVYILYNIWLHITPLGFILVEELIGSAFYIIILNIYLIGCLGYILRYQIWLPLPIILGFYCCQQIQPLIWSHFPIVGYFSSIYSCIVVVSLSLVFFLVVISPVYISLLRIHSGG